MRRELLMPKLGLTMEEGAVVEWMLEPGQRFEAGQPIFVVESEKAANEITAQSGGVLLETSASIGQAVPVGAVIGYWDDGASLESGAVTPARTANGSNEETRARVPVTPLARRLASQRGIDLRAVRGSGPRGRIRVRDLPDQPTPGAEVRTGAAARTAATATAPFGATLPPTARERAAAKRLLASKRDIPHFYLSVEAEVSRLQSLRAELREAGVRMSLNDFILAAVGRALLQAPAVNRIWSDDGIVSFDGSDVGMAVHTERGLLVPVLRDLGRLRLDDVARVATAAIEGARQGNLTADEMAGGAITVSNAGMHDVTYMTSIINPGQSMILGVGSIRELFRPDAAGQPALRREIGLVLSADHRVMDGVTALAFLKHVVAGLEQPLRLVFG